MPPAARPPRFRLVVFDLDGTLIDSRPDIAAAVNLALADHGQPPWADEDIEPMIGEGARNLIERAIAGRLPEGRLEAVLAAYNGHYGRHRSERTRVYPGVLDGLARLSGVARAIATNKPAGLARAIAADLGLSPLIDLVLGDGDVGERKPDPAMLDRAMTRLGGHRESTLYVGDSPIDVETARRAQVPLCLVGWGYKRGEDPPAAYHAERFDDVVELVLGRV